MKNGWTINRLGNLCEFVRGPFGGSLKKSVFVEDGFAVYEQQHAIYNQFEDVRYFISETKFKEMGRFELRPNDLIMSCSGTMGRVAIVPENIRRGVINQALLKLTPKHEILPEFLKHWMDSDEFQQSLKEQSGGAAIQNVASVAVLKEIKITHPTFAEQKRIVGILDEAFEGIATAKANAEKNLQNARDLFESHLHAVFTQRGGGWVEKSVGDLVSDGVLVKPFDGNHGEIHPKKTDYTESGVPFIMACDLVDGGVDTKSCTFISKKLADSLRVGFAKDGDVLISHKGTIGRSAVVNTDADYIMLTPQVTAYRIKDQSKLFNRFIRYYFMSPAFQRDMIAAAADGATRAYIGITKQLALRFRFPDLGEQQRIADELDVLDPETKRLESVYQRKLAALDELKKSLLHRAFNGEL